MRLTRQIGSLGTANLIYLLCQLGVLSLLTQLSDLETVAAFGFIMAVVQPLYMLLRMGLRANLATDAKREFNFSTFLTIRVVSAIVLFVAPLLVIALVRPEYLVLAVPIALMNATESLSDLCYGGLQRAGLVQLVARSMLLRGPAALLLFGITLYVTRDAQIAFWAQTAVWVSIQLLHDFPGVRRSGETIALDRDWGRIVALLRNTAFLGLGQFFAALQTSLPRFFVEAMLGTTAMAFFTAVSVLQRATISLFNTLEQAIGWRLSQIWASGNRDRFFSMLRKMLAVAVGLGILGMGLAWAIGEPFLALFFGPEYAAAYGLLMWIAAAISMRLISSVVQTALTAQRRFGSFGTVQTIALIVTVPFTYLGIQLYGLEGAGMAILATVTLRTAVFTYFLLRD
ncbi:lipopolysaccharide biosynthesis protein [Actibacterium atlanticum]|nr:lipopolysaccharide biosynthesis protein [Actibacterium atlanticum]